MPPESATWDTRARLYARESAQQSALQAERQQPTSNSVGQELWLEMGYSTENQLAYVPIVVPPVGARVIVPGFQSGVGPALGMLRRATERRLWHLGR